MPTIITHSLIAAAPTWGLGSGKQTVKLLLLSLFCSLLPDADVLGYHWLYIPSYSLWGHRGFFHSPFFAAMLSIFVVLIFYRGVAFLSKRWWKYVVYFFIIGASHGVLDAMTNGGNGIALLSPFTNNRYFLPWTPIEVSPLTIKRFLGQRGLTVLISELIWIWAPLFLVLIFLKLKRSLAQRYKTAS